MNVFVCLFVKCFGNPHSGESEVIYLHVLPQSTTKRWVSLSSLIAVTGAYNISHIFPLLNFIKILFLTFRFHLAPLALLKLQDQLTIRNLPVLRLGDGFVKIKLKVTPELPTLMIRHSRRVRLY